MKSHSYQRLGTHTYFSQTYPQWNGTYTSNVGPSWALSVEGFGPNPGVRFVDATPGEYRKLNVQTPKGFAHIGHYDFYGNYIVDSHREGHLQDDHVSYWFLPYMYKPASYDSTTYNNALSDLYEGVRKTEANLALTIGEARESGRMLKVGKSIYEVLVLARRARRQAITNPSKTISEIWLSYKYGWSPLLNDIYGYLNWIWTLPEKGIPIRGRSRRVEKFAEPLYGYADPKSYATLKGKQEWRSEVKVWLDVGDSELFNLTRITSLNPLSIAWELVPLSFVVDWFYDVGGYLQNAEAAFGSGLTFKRGYTSEVYYCDGSVNFFKDETTPWGYRYNEGWTSSSVQAWKRRTKLSDFPFPRAPTLNLRLGWQRIVSAAALLRVILLGKVR